MRAPRFHQPLPEPDADLDEIARFTYQELDIENFIAPACLQGLFDRIEWLQRDEPPATWRFCVTSLRGERKVLATRKQEVGGEEPRRDPGSPGARGGSTGLDPNRRPPAPGWFWGSTSTTSRATTR